MRPTLVSCLSPALFFRSMPEFSDLLRPFLSRPLSVAQLNQAERYLALLLKWNAKISLTAVRTPEEIVQRHFGESLFAGEQTGVAGASSLIDMGSGAGFPGLPIAILAPEVRITLIESQHKKVAFSREVIRALELRNTNVYAGRAEQAQLWAEIVTMRAVEKFEAALLAASTLVQPSGRLALLIGASQAKTACQGRPDFAWRRPISIPESRERILLIGQRADVQGDPNLGKAVNSH